MLSILNTCTCPKPGEEPSKESQDLGSQGPIQPEWPRKETNGADL